MSDRPRTPSPDKDAAITTSTANVTTSTGTEVELDTNVRSVTSTATRLASPSPSQDPVSARTAGPAISRAHQSTVRAHHVPAPTHAAHSTINQSPIQGLISTAEDLERDIVWFGSEEYRAYLDNVKVYARKKIKDGDRSDKWCLCLTAAMAKKRWGIAQEDSRQAEATKEWSKCLMAEKAMLTEFNQAFNKLEEWRRARADGDLA